MRHCILWRFEQGTDQIRERFATLEDQIRMIIEKIKIFTFFGHQFVEHDISVTK